MYEFSSSEFIDLYNRICECLIDCSCLDAWVDSLEYDVRQYIGDKPFLAFRGFSRALTNHIEKIREICKSKDLFLDL